MNYLIGKYTAMIRGKVAPQRWSNNNAFSTSSSCEKRTEKPPRINSVKGKRDYRIYCQDKGKVALQRWSSKKIMTTIYVSQVFICHLRWIHPLSWGQEMLHLCYLRIYMVIMKALASEEKQIKVCPQKVTKCTNKPTSIRRRPSY